MPYAHTHTHICKYTQYVQFSSSLNDPTFRKCLWCWEVLEGPQHLAWCRHWCRLEDAVRDKVPGSNTHSLFPHVTTNHVLSPLLHARLRGRCWGSRANKTDQATAPKELPVHQGSNCQAGAQRGELQRCRGTSPRSELRESFWRKGCLCPNLKGNQELAR